MNVSHRHQCVFFHVPRTGGSSIQALGWWDEWTGHFPPAREAPNRPTYFSFALVRNPWDRFVSLYHYFAAMTPKHPWYRANRPVAADVRRFRSFAEFCHGFSTWRHRDNFHFRPQCHWITDGSGKPLVDFVGRFERLEHDFSQVCARLGLPQPRLPKKNGSPHGPYHAYYDDRSREIVAAVAQADVTAFRYAFEGATGEGATS